VLILEKIRRRRCSAAERLGLPETAADLAELVDRDQFPALIAALVRTKLAGTTNEDLASQGKEATRQ